MLGEPLKWRKPQRVFVNSMSDLFHENVPDEFIDKVFLVMGLARQHTFQVLTKRPERMRDYCASNATRDRLINTSVKLFDGIPGTSLTVRETGDGFDGVRLDNVWLGVSVEDQKTADERIPLLLQTPAAVRFVSAEPLLGFVNLCPWIDADWSPTLNTWKWSPIKAGPSLDWVIVGGESGPKARQFRPHWARQIVGPCKAARVPVFVKQMGSNVVDRNDAGFDGNDGIGWPAHLMEENRIEDIDTGYQGAPVRLRLRDRKGGDMSEWPEDLRVRQFPNPLRGWRRFRTSTRVTTRR